LRKEALPAEEVLQILEEMRARNLSYDRFFSTMCTLPHPIAVRAHNMFLETNLGDPGLFPGAALMEQKAVEMMGDLLHCPDAVGYISTGGTESNIQAIRAARNASGIRDGNIIVPASAHFSFDKIADLLCLEVRKAELDKSLKVDLSSVESLVDERTVALVGIAGTTEFGQVDPIDGLARIAREHRIHLHVDAAFGGFVLPFLKGDWRWDFAVDGVSSITIDPHKMGLAIIPAGGLLFRGERCMDALETDTHYLTKATDIFDRNQERRSGCGHLCRYDAHGERRVHRDGRLLHGFDQVSGSSAKGIGVLPVIEPVMNVVALKAPSPAKVREDLMERNWQVSADQRTGKGAKANPDAAHDQREYRHLPGRSGRYLALIN
jgi:tyrosine decarboxylase/aspartate 1-decarboxylase